MTLIGDRSDASIAVVAEAFLDQSLPHLLDWLREAVPEVSAVELGAGGYAPHPHCNTSLLLNDAAARAEWRGGVESRGFSIAALNAWGNPLHPDPVIARRHDRDLREAIRLAAALDVSRVVALAGCPAGVPGDTAPHFAAGGWLPYLEGMYEAQWEAAVAPYWSGISEFTRAEHPGLLLCIELHPGTVVYNVETFLRLAALGNNLGVNIDPSHFFWQQMDTAAVVAALRSRIGHVHAKDLLVNPRVLAVNGLLDHRWPGPTSEVPWSFATVGRGHDESWWREFLCSLEGTCVHAIAIEHEDMDVPPEVGVAAAAKLLGRALVSVVRAASANVAAAGGERARVPDAASRRSGHR